MRNYLLVFIFLLLSVRGFGQCPQSVTITSSSNSICSGNSVTLTAKPSGGTAPYTYTWSTGETKQSIDVNKAGTYKVTVTGATPGCQPVFATININVSATPDAPTVENANISVCPNSPATLKATGPGGFYQWYDSNGNFLIASDTYNTPPLTGNRIYYVTTTVNECTSAKTQVSVTLASKPNVTGATVCMGNQAILTASGGDTYAWYPTSAATGTPITTNSTFLTQPLNTTTTYYVVVTNNGCRSIPTPVTATVTPPPQKPVVSNANPSVCSGSSANLHANDAPGIFAWFDVPSGGTPLIYSPDFTTPPLTATKTYYVQNSINGCESSRTAVTVNVNPLPSAPAPQTVGACAGTTATLTMPTIASISYEWYDAPSGGTPLITADSYTTPVLNSSTNYYVQAVNSGGCTSTRTQIQVVVNPAPQAPSVSGQSICYNSQAVLTPTGPGGAYKWYNVATGGTAIITNTPNSFTTQILQTTTTYYVETTISGCTSARVPVTVTVSPAVTPPTAPGTSVCSGDPATLTATGGSATSVYDWYATQTGGSSLATEQVFITQPITATTTFYVQITDNDCVSTRTPVVVTVNAIPAAPTASNTTTCPGTPASLTANVASGTVEWFGSPSGGFPLKTGNPFITPKLNTTTTYYVQNTIGSCSSSRTPVTVTVSSPIEPQFQYPSGTVCVSSPDVTPVINNPAGGTFTSSPAGLVFVSNTTGQINVAASTVGDYIITFNGNGTCVVPESAKFSIATTANAQFALNAGYCQDDINPLPTFNSGASGGNFSASPAGLVFVNTSTGQIDLKKSKPGPYTITNTITPGGGCGGATYSVPVTIYQSVTVNAGPDQTVASGSPVQLNGSITGGASTGKWSGGAGTFSNINSTKAIYTPTAAETSATLTLTSVDPPGLCGPKTDQVVITFKNSPASPTVTGNNTCAGSSATLTAIAPGGAYNWYDVPTGGLPISSVPIYKTPVLLANTTYYIEVTNSVGVTSPREAILVTVNAIPTAPVVTGVTAICVGNKTTLTTNDPTGYYTWYDAPVNGNKLLINMDTYTTPFLTSDQTYYVQKKVNECLSPMTAVTVTVSKVPTITSINNGGICSGNPLSYTITSDVPTATFLWSRAQVTGISNPAVNNQTSNTITETLINTSSAAVNVTYFITPINNSCSGTLFPYVVTVYPTPGVTSSNNPPSICNSTPVNYSITFNTVANFFWSRSSVPGITNAAVSGQASSTIKEALFNTTNAPIDVTYVITSNTSTCPGVPFSMKVTVNPAALITSASANPSACSGEPQNYLITSSIPSATFLWSRYAVNNISNVAVLNQTSSTIDEALINTGNSAVKVTYVITPVAYGCPGVPFNYVVTVKPQPVTPQPNINSPVCVGSTIILQTTAVSNATYIWTAPDGKIYNGQKVEIKNVTKANAGTYSLSIVVNGCSSLPQTKIAEVNDPPTVDAGKGKIVCILDPIINLHGTIGGGVPTGIWTTVSGTGTFSPSVNYPATTQYIPTAADKAAGQVVLRLTATRKDDCTITSSDVTFQFGPLPAVFAGPDLPACSQTNAVQLAGSTSIASRVEWKTLGSGLFNSASQKNAVYMPSPADIANGSVKLVLLALDAGVCDIPSDTMKINFIPPPTVNAGGIRYVLKNRTITLNPTVSDNNVTYLWTPNIDINDNTAKNPVITGDIDRTYTLQVTDSRGCVSKDTTFIKVSPLIVIPNTFTPNGDGVNDLWNIEGLIAYSDATVDIFTRYGQKVFHSKGYDKAWDGIYNGKELPVGVYYYVIDTKLFNQVFSGSLTIIR